MFAVATQVQAAMEGAASAANSRSTSHAASRAQSPDLHLSQHVHVHSPEASVQHEFHLSVPFSSELQVGQSSPIQQQLPATDDAVDSDFSQAASQPGSSHSSPAVSKQQSSSPAAHRAAAAQASLAAMDTIAAALLFPEAPAAESKQTDDVPVPQNLNSDAMLSQQSCDLMSYEKAMKDISSSFHDMLRQSGSLANSTSSHESSPDIQQMQPAMSEPALCPHEASEACNSPLHPSASLPSNDSQSSCSNEHSLQPETAQQAAVGPEASCNSDAAQSSGYSSSDTAAELHTDTGAIPAAPARVTLPLGSSPASSNSSCRHSLNGKLPPPGGHDSTGTSLCSQAPVSTSVVAGDSRSTLDSSTSPTTGSSSAAVVEAGTMPLSAPAQLCLASDTRQAEAAPLQHDSEHSVELGSPSSQRHASQSATSQSRSSKQVSYQTEQSKRGHMGAAPQGGGPAASSVSWLAADQQDEQDRHFRSSLQVGKHASFPNCGENFSQQLRVQSGFVIRSILGCMLTLSACYGKTSCTEH